MKKKIAMAVVFASAVMFSGCYFTIPKTFTIKTNANYNFTIANKSYDLKDYFSISSLMKSSTDDLEESENKYNIYDYNPGGNAQIQQYLLQMDIQEIPLDFGNYLEQADFSDSIKNMSIDKEIEIPEIDINQEKELDLDIGEKINNLVTFDGLTSDEAHLTITFTDAGNGFESLTYKSGFMTIIAADYESIDINNIDLSDVSTIMSEKLTGTVKLYDSSSTEPVAEAEFVDGVANLPLNNITITPEGMSFSFDTKQNVKFVGKVDSTSQVKEAKGLSLKDSVSGLTLDTTISLGDNASFDSCEIGDGSIEVAFTQPEGWTGVNLSYVMTLTGGIDAVFTEAKTTEDLAGKTLKNEDISVSTAVSISLSNATLAFIDADGKESNPKVSVNTKINKINSVEVNLGEDYSAKIEQTQDFPDEVLDAVNGIVWGESGIKIKYINTLPAGNDLTIGLTSDFLGFDNKTETITHTDEDNPMEIEFLCDDGRTTKIGKNAGEYSSVDVTAEINFEGYDSANKTITVKNVEPGTKYKLSLDIEPVFDWQSISINSSLSNQTGTINANFSLSSVFKTMEDTLGVDIAKSVQIKNLPLYIFCDVPDVSGAFENPEFKGTIKAFTGDKDNNPITGSKDVYLLGTSEEPGILPSYAVPELKFNDDETEVITDLSKELSGYEGVNISDLISASANTEDTDGSLCINYDVQFVTGKEGEDAITISSDALESLKASGSTSIKLSVMAIFNMDFDVIEPLNLDVLKLINKSDDDSEEKNSDLLGRTEAPDYSTYQKYVDVIDNISLSYSPTKLPFKAEGDVDLVIDIDGEGTDYDEKVLSLKGGKLKVDDPGKLLNIYPLEPKINLVVPKGNLTIPREMIFETKIDLGIHTDGQIKIWDFYEVENEEGN